MLTGYVATNIELLKKLEEQEDRIQEAIQQIIKRFHQGSHLFALGNGGSAAQAADFASEFANKFYGAYDRRPLPARALFGSDALVTAIGNDAGYENIFVKLLEPWAKAGDVLAAFSTSGNSENAIRALQWAKEKGMYTLGFAGMPGGKMATYCDICFFVPHTRADYVQNAHSVLLHYICQQIDAHFRGNPR